MINLITLKSVLRNRRFIIFTIIFPIFWFVGMKISIGSNNASFNSQWFMLASLMGIIGNSIVTLGKRVTATKQFYFLQFKTTPYAIWKWIIDTLIIQLLLNLLIMVLISLTAWFMNSLSLDIHLFLQLFLLSIFGLYISAFGLTLGFCFKSDLLDMGGFPIMCFVGLLITPFHVFWHSHIADVITVIQKCFPGYYIIQMANNTLSNHEMMIDWICILVTSILTLLPPLLFVWHYFHRFSN